MLLWAKPCLLIALLCASCSKDGGVNSDEYDDGANFNSSFKSPGDGSLGAWGIDPLASESWHLENTGQKTYSAGAGPIKAHEDTRLLDSHDLNEGEGVRVGISDNGTEIMHEDLYFNIDQSAMRNYMSDDPSQWLSEPTPSGEESAAHGTAVAGIIGAIKNNSRGSHGIAPAATLIPFKFIGVSGTNYFAKEMDQASGNIDVFNYSYGRGTCAYRSLAPLYLEQLRFGATNQRGGKGSLYVKAAGNEYVSYLGDCLDDDETNDLDFYFGNAAFEADNSSPFVIVVGGLNANGTSASYSTPGSSLWVSAPAGEYGDQEPAILTTDLMGCKLGYSHSGASLNNFEKGDSLENSDCNYTSTMNGTSAAAPMVSGAIALILGERPELSWRDVKDILARSARVVHNGLGATPHPINFGASASPSGHTYLEGWIENKAGFRFHNWYGFGGLDIRAALELARERETSLPALYETISHEGLWKYQRTTALAIPDNSAAGVETTIEIEEDLQVEALQLRLSVTHGRASDLGVEVTSPGGTKSQLMLVNSKILDKNLEDIVLLSNAFYGEGAKGVWTVKVLDGRSGVLGEMKKWGLNILGHYKGEAPISLAKIKTDQNLRKMLAKIHPVSTLGEEGALALSSKEKSEGIVSKERELPPKTLAARGPNSRTMGQRHTRALKFEGQKEQGLVREPLPGRVRSCLRTNLSTQELELVRGANWQPLLAREAHVMAFLQDVDEERTLVLIKSERDDLLKVLLFDRELQLVDERFLEQLRFKAELSVGEFKNNRAFFLHQLGLSALDLKSLELVSTTKIEGLEGLVSTPLELKAWSQRETFEFDGEGVILARATSAPAMKQERKTILPWCEGQSEKEQLIERSK